MKITASCRGRDFGAVGFPQPVPYLRVGDIKALIVGPKGNEPQILMDVSRCRKKLPNSMKGLLGRQGSCFFFNFFQVIILAPQRLFPGGGHSRVLTINLTNDYSDYSFWRHRLLIYMIWMVETQNQFELKRSNKPTVDSIIVMKSLLFVIALVWSPPPLSVWIVFESHGFWSVLPAVPEFVSGVYCLINGLFWW